MIISCKRENNKQQNKEQGKVEENRRKVEGPEVHHSLLTIGYSLETLTIDPSPLPIVDLRLQGWENHCMFVADPIPVEKPAEEVP